jgi:tetratricopeptide (TPR) repeat protein
MQLSRMMHVGTAPSARGETQDRLRARGVMFLERGAFARAADEFRRIVRVAPHSPQDRAYFALALVRSGQTEEAEAELRAALRLAPDAPDLHAYLGQLLARGDRRVQAVRYFERALELAPDHWAAKDLLDLRAQIMESVHSWHLHMLADSARNDAFEAAIQAAVRPDDVVLDIGTGTGLLAMMAARAGARQVVACEMLADLAELARVVVDANGYASRIRVVARRSTELEVGRDLPSRATLLIAEIFDSLLIGEGVLETFRHAHAHLLAPGARVIPAGGVLRGQLAAIPRFKRMYPLCQINGFDLRAFARHGLEKQFYLAPLEADEWQPLSEPLDIIRFDFAQQIEPRQDWSLPARIDRTGTVQGLVLWMELQLDANTTLASGPGGQARHWTQVVFVFDQEREVAAGDILALQARMDANVLFFDIQGRASGISSSL